MASRAFDQSQQFRSKRRATVPELYRKAALILKSAEERKGSLKNLVYSSGFRVSDPYDYTINGFVWAPFHILKRCRISNRCMHW